MSINEELKNQILSSIELQGGASDDEKVINLIIGSRSNRERVIDFSSGSARIRYNLVKQFSLILSQPFHLSSLSPFQIRCCLCGRVISYPAWHLSLKYKINWFEFFVCFDDSSNTKVSTKCYRS